MNDYTFPRQFVDPMPHETDHNVYLTDDHIMSDHDTMQRMLMNDLSPFFVDNNNDLNLDYPTYHFTASGNDTTYAPVFDRLIDYITMYKHVVLEHFADDPMFIDLAIRCAPFALPRRYSAHIHTRSDHSVIFARLHAHYMSMHDQLTFDRVADQLLSMYQLTREHLPNAIHALDDDFHPFVRVRIPSLMHLMYYSALTPQSLITPLFKRFVRCEQFLNIVLFCNSHYDMPRLFADRFSDLHRDAYAIEFDDLRVISAYMHIYTTFSFLSMRYPSDNRNALNNVHYNDDPTHQYYNTLPRLDAPISACETMRLNDRFDRPLSSIFSYLDD